MPRAPRHVLGLALFFLMAVAAVAPLADAAGKPAPRIVTVRAVEGGACPDGTGPCWDTPVIVVAPGDNVTVIIDLTQSGQPHDFTLTKADGSKDKAFSATSGGIHYYNFTFPQNAKSLAFFCSVHPHTMTGQFVIASAVGQAGGGEAVEALGVHFLSYWVGTIAFAILFVVYGLTFFLFKYNETTATTDQWDRAGAEENLGRRAVSPGRANLLAILLGLVIIVAVVLVARVR